MQNKSRVKIIYWIWSFLALVGVVKYLKIGIADKNFSNNILFFILFVMIEMMIRRAMRLADKKKMIFSIILSLVCSGMLVVGAQIESLRAIVWTFGTCLKILFLALFLVPVFIFIFQACTTCRLYSPARGRVIWTKRKLFFVILAFWGIAYLALFPGIYDYDSIDQTLQFLVTKKISGHHPVLHSFLLSFFVGLGEKVFGSHAAGLGMFSFLQMAFLAYAAMEVSWRMYEKKYRKLFLFSLGFYVFFPLHYVMSVWVAKDIIFTSLFVLLSLSLYDMIDKQSQFWENKRNIVRYIVLAVLMCFFRNNGIYALLLMIPVCFFCFKKFRTHLMTSTIIAMCAYLLLQNVLFAALGVTAGNMREMLSIPCQQMAKVYVETPHVYTEEEKAALFELIPEKNVKDYQYRPMISDATKNYFDTEQFQSRPMYYAKLYLKIGMKSPRKYIEAFLANSLGFWYPNKSYPDERMYHPYVEFEMADPNLFKGDYIYIERASKLPFVERILKNVVAETGWENIPMFSNLFVPATYFLLLCFGIVISFFKKQYNQLILFGFWGGFWITLLISPVALVRYAYPVIFCLPILVHSIFSGNETMNEKV